MSKELTKGCVVYMNPDSGMKGYGNTQCVSWVSHELGELSLYGHNEHYKTYDVRGIVEYPQDANQEKKKEAIEFADWLSNNHYTYNRPSKKYFDESFELHEPDELYSLFLIHKESKP